MLKEFLVLAVTAFCLAKATNSHTADVDFLHKQKRIYELFMYIDQAKLFGSDCYEVGHSFDIESNIDFFNDKMVVKEFLYRFKLGMLHRGALFSVYYKEHRDELRVLFHLFYSAKDFTTFYKTACFCRLYMNQGMFITALTTAVMYRPDCKHIILPPMYEVYPHLFFDNEYIQEAHRYKMTAGFKKGSSFEHIEPFFIDKNYTSSFMKHYVDKEYALDYFTDDVGLNNYYYYVRNLFPFWITIKDLDLPKHIRGEFYYYVHQQLLAHYYLERLSNGLGEIEDFDFYRNFGPGYFSTLVYSNGVAVPNRDRYTSVPTYKYKFVKEIENIETRILAAIDSGFLYDYDGKKIGLYTPEGFNFLGNIIEGNYDSCNTRFYGAIDALYRDIFGFNFDCKHKHCVVPSALQTYTAALRDPAFYRLYKRIIGYFLRFKCHLPAYTASELEFSGVKIHDVKVDKLYTFMEPFDTFINNAVAVDSFKDGMMFNIKAKKYRLNYKPFTYNFNVVSDKVTKGMVRIFLGPSYDDYYFKEENYMFYSFYNFVELDKFIVDLKPGVNVFERHSTNSIFTAKDFVGGDFFYKKLLKAIEGNEPFTYTDNVYGFPENLYLPKGKVGGMPFKLFVYISPVDESKFTYFDLPIFGKFLYDGKPFGFPLDRPMLPYMTDLSNMFMKDVFIHFTKDYFDGYFSHKDYHKDYVYGESVKKTEVKEKPFYFMDYNKTPVF